MSHGIRTDTRSFPLAQLSPGQTCRRLVTHRIYTPQAGRAALSYPRHLSQARVSSSKKNRESLVFRPASAGHPLPGGWIAKRRELDSVWENAGQIGYDVQSHLLISREDSRTLFGLVAS